MRGGALLGRLSCMLVVLAGGLAGATEIHVAPDGSGDVPTIQAAIDAAGADDVIVLADGVYTGPGNRDLLLGARNCQVRSQSGDAASCVIDLQAHAGFLQVHAFRLTLDDLTLTNGAHPVGGGAVRSTAGFVTFTRCRFHGNSGSGGDGGAIDITSNYPHQTSTLTGCEFWGNTAGSGGAAAMQLHNSRTHIIGCRFFDHAGTASAVVTLTGNYTLMTDCVFASNSVNAGTIRAENGLLDIERCVLAHNDAGFYGAAVLLWFSSVNARDCTFLDNGGTYAGDINQYYADPGDVLVIERCLFAYARAPYSVAGSNNSTPVVSCSNIYTAGGAWHLVIADQLGENGNLDTDPLFCDYAGGDLRLADISPCLPANNSCGVQIGFYGQGCVSDGYVVYPDGHGALADIQTAIDVVPTGGEVLLADGVFAGEGNRDLDFRGKALTLRSLSGDPAACVIDAGGVGRGFVFHSLEGSASVVRGITVRGGWSDGAGGAVLVEQSSPWFEDCRFEGSSAVWGGGLAATTDAWPVLRRCVFHGNQAVLGAAVSLQGARLDAYSCTLAANHSDGAAVFVQASTVRFEQSLIAHNTGGLAAWIMPGAEIQLAACDIFGNEGGDWTAPFIEQLDTDGNFLAPPCFCDLDLGVLTLCANSWCLPANNPLGDDVLVGALGAGCDACDCDGPVSNEDDADDDVVVPPLAGTAIAAHPNPFNPATTITYRLDRAGAARVAVFDLRGRLVSTLLQADLPAGEGRVLWTGRDDQGRAVEAGTYLCRLDGPGGVRTVAVTLVK